MVIPYWKIWPRTGHSGAWGLLMLVPLANLISLWVLAFKEWPALRAGEEATTTMDLRKLIIDGIEIEVDPRLTLLQACEQAGVEIPRFCYHERLSIAGNRRMCLVEVVVSRRSRRRHARCR